MWFERDVLDKIAELDELVDNLRESQDDDEIGWDEETEKELEGLEWERSAYQAVLRDDAKPDKIARMSLDELLQPLKEAGFFCQLVDEPRNLMRSKILTIAKDGIAGHSYKFNLEQFLHDLMVGVEDYHPTEHMRLELNVGLMPITASPPQGAEKKE